MTTKELKKIKKILSDVNSAINEFDIVFIIDATGSMSSYIEAAKCEAKNISEELSKKFPDMDFQYGYVFYRDPIDSKGDKHEIINLTNDVNSLPEQISKIAAYGGGDLPEDWVGAYKKVNEEINWRNGNKAIFHLADAGAHGKLFSTDDHYPDEEQKLINELEILSTKKIKIFGFVIEEAARNSFEECKKIYQSKGGAFEIYNFEKPKVSITSNSLFGCPIHEEKYEKKDINKIDSLFYKNSSNSEGLFSNNNSGGLFGNNNSSNNLFFYNNNKNTGSLFGKCDNDNNKVNNTLGENNIKNTGSLFGNISNYNKVNNIFGDNNKNKNNGSLFGNISNDNKVNNIFDFNFNKNTGSLFGNISNNNKVNNIIDDNNNKKTGSLFGNSSNDNNKVNNIIDDNNNKNCNSLFQNNNSNKNSVNLSNNNTNSYNNKSDSLFNRIDDKKNNSSSLFGNSNSIYNNFQSTINSQFRNLVVDSIQNMSNK